MKVSAQSHTEVSQKTCELRWNNGDLEQLVQYTRHTDKGAVGRSEWVPVERVDQAQEEMG